MSLSAPLSYLDPALAFPNITASPSRVASHKSSAELASSPSLYVTFKVLQLVNQFRKRVRTRVHSTGRSKRESSTRLTEDLCQAFEREAPAHIHNLLGKSRVPPSRKTPYPDRNRRSILQKRKASRRSVRTATAAKADPDLTAKKVEWLLKALNKSVQSEGHSLSDIAKDHELFVERKEDFHIEHDSWKELIPQLVRINNLLDTLRRAPSSRGVKTYAESDEGVDLSFDDNIVANLEHLLLCLKEQLIRLLIAELRDLVQSHVIECQRDQNKHTKEVILEYPDGQHPLSTTWPWSIRPSLAVLWGVCWMFYEDNFGNIRDDNNGALLLSWEQRRSLNWDVDQLQAQGQPRHMPTTPIQQHQYQVQQSPNQQQEYFAARDIRQAPLGSPNAQRRIPPPAMNAHSPVMAQPHSQHNLFGGGQTAHHQFFQGPPDQAALAVGGVSGFPTNTRYSAAPRATYVAAGPAPPAADAFSLPEDFTAQNFTFDNTAYGADETWQPTAVTHPAQQPADYQYAHSPQALPPHSRGPVGGSLRLNTANFGGLNPSHPPQEFLSTTPVSAVSATSSNYGHHLSPYDAVLPREGRFSMSEQQQSTPPRSESPHQATVPAPQNPRKRSFGEMAEVVPVPNHQAHSREGSHAGSDRLQPHDHQSGEEGHSPRMRPSNNRGEPPQRDGKYICTYEVGCRDLTFDRKCEWNKHMDKHERPFRCQHPDCAKLQGFTYSGGLLRHQREVHNQHGGPKTQLMCNYPDCKRKNKGFTRKENLNEHIRRVHSKDSQSQTPLKRDDTDATAGAIQDAETPASRGYSESGLEHDDSLLSPTQQPKRRRLNSGEASETEMLRQQVLDLQARNNEMNERLKQFEEMMNLRPAGQQHGPSGQS